VVLFLALVCLCSVLPSPLAAADKRSPADRSPVEVVLAPD
jgi:hypothetical protein